MSALALLLLIVIAVLAWQASLRSRDLAIRTARHICKTQGLQFLDGTAALQSIRPVLSRDAGPGIKRIYTFDFSSDRVGRRTGSIIILNGNVSAILHDDG